jgi:competence protein ComEA
MASPLPPPYTTKDYDSITQQQTMPVPVTPILPTTLPDVADSSKAATIKRRVKRVVAVAIALILIIIMYFIWNPPTPTPISSGASITQQNFGSGSTVTASSSSSGDIQVYIVGAIKHPGVYTLPAGARVYALLQAAGGPLPKANLVALNLAATLTDGEEVYVTAIGEVPPTYMGGVPGPPGSNTTGSPTTSQLVNINTASVDEMRQSLHLSSTTAQNIVNYRLQHGSFTSVDQLLQVVSRSIYDKIEGQVTV